MPDPQERPDAKRPMASPDSPRVNCWQDRQCGCEPACPAAIDTTCGGVNGGVNAGRLCWQIEGTPCAPGTREEKRPTCEACSFFRRVKYEEGGRFQPVKPGLGSLDPQELHRLLNDTMVLTSVGRDILGHLAVHPLLLRAAEYARAVTRAEAAAVYLRAADHPAWQLAARAGGKRVSDTDCAEHPSGRSGNRCLRPFSPWIDREAADPVARAARDRRLCRESHPGAEVVAIPLSGETEPAGVVALVKKPGTFSVNDEWFLRELALMAGLGLQNARIVERLRELRDLDKAKSRFVALLMHQIGSPLATVACSLQALGQLGDKLTAEDRRMLITTSLDRIQGIQDLKRKLLDLAAIRSGRHLAAREAVAAAEALRQEVEAASLRATQEGLELIADIGDHPAPVRADPDGLRLIFANLIDNAIKYSAGQGRTVEVGLAVGGGEVRVTVRDQGIGIPPEEQVRLFEEFHRAGNAAAAKVAGSGLGLAFVSELVTRYGGRVDVESEVGRGTTFTVIFPLGGIRRTA